MKFSKFPKKLSKSIISFINKYGYLIDANDFTTLYAIATDTLVDLEVTKLTESLYACGIDVLEQMKEIPENFLAYSRHLIEIKIPDTVEKIKDSAFYNCVSVKELTIPKSVKVIESWALAEMDELKELTIEGELQALSSFSICKLPALEKIYSINKNRDILFNRVAELKLGQVEFVSI